MVKSHKLIYHLIIVYLVQNEVLAEEEEEILVVLYSKKIPTCKNKTQKCYRLWLSKIQKRNSTIELTLKSELHIIWWTIQLLVFDKIKLFFDYQLKYQFWKKSLPKNATLLSWTLLQHFWSHFWAWLLLYSAITPKSEEKYFVKVFNSTELHFFLKWLLSKSVL